MFGDLKLIWDLWGYWTDIKGGDMTPERWLELATLLIPFITPLITAGIKKIWPKLPKIVVIILQPILGAIFGALSDLSLATPTLATGAVLGGTGVYVREGIDQFKKAVVSYRTVKRIPRFSDEKTQV